MTVLWANFPCGKERGMERSGAPPWGLEDVTRLCGVAGVRLSLDEVREVGRTAFFFDFGEALMYLDGEIFDIHDWGTSMPADALSLPLPREVLEGGVGIEYGWRHLRGCACHLCATWAQHGAGLSPASHAA
jgi:hypothetical protein